MCQNLIWATQQKRKPTRWNIRLIDGEAEQLLGELHLKYDPSPESKRLPFVAEALGGSGGGNLIYVNGAADAEKAANQLFDLVPRESGPLSQEIIDLIELTRRTVHTNYALSRVLERGIAFHYGNMPLILRLGIERLFKLDRLRFLVCTSTLLEGVNLPCRNIFVRGPQKGRGHAMTPSDFWNLAGRAGRWGKEFQGNIVCIDADQANVWKTYGAPRRRARSRIHRTVDQVASEPSKIADFIRAGTPREIAAQSPALEQYVSYAWAYWRQNRSLDGFPAARSISESDAVKVAEQIERADKSLTLPDEVIIRNQGISPIAMQSLFEYFAERGRSLDEYLPAAASSNDAVESYVRIIERINGYLAVNVFGVTNPRRFQLALLIVGWMRGYPLARLISSWIGSLEKRKKPVRLAAEIRSVMSDVENVARFIAPKYIGCYVDVLRAFFAANHHNEYESQLSDISLQLELGASTPTQISLIGLGLTRTTAVEIAGLIANSELDKGGVLVGLQSNAGRRLIYQI